MEGRTGSIYQHWRGALEASTGQGLGIRLVNSVEGGSLRNAKPRTCEPQGSQTSCGPVAHSASFRSRFGSRVLAIMPLTLDGPWQLGQGQNGQYVYWVCMAYPTPETVQNHGVKIPDDLDRESFRVAVVEVHMFAGVDLLETVCFLEPHVSGKPHLNLLVRASRPYRWLRDAVSRCLAINSQKYTTSTA